MKKEKITVLYEDDDVVVVNKPAGILVHADGVHKEETLADWALKHYPQMKDVGEEEVLKNGTAIFRPGIVHRLDKETSGVLLLCKTKGSHTYFKRAFQNRKIHKEYHALVYGPVKDERGVIKRPIGRSSSDFRQFSAQRGARGELREATTQFVVREKGSDASFLHVFPITGRTHQIRVHLKAVHHPIVCDSLYASGKPCLFGLNRPALHAYKLTWPGRDGKEKSVIAPYPDDFETALTSFRQSIAESLPNVLE